MSNMCPRCGRELDWAIATASRWDGTTTVCDTCSFEEAAAESDGGREALNPWFGARKWKRQPK